MTVYTKFTIKNFRCFSDEQVLRFAQPTNDKLGSGITYIVGANNSGKTTLIESMCLKKDEYIDSSAKRSEPIEIKYYCENDNPVRTVKLLRANSNLLTESLEKEHNKTDGLFQIVGARRQWDSNFGKGAGKFDQILHSSTLGISPRRQLNNVSVAGMLSTIENDQKKYDEFTNLVRKVLPEFTDWNVGSEGQQLYIQYNSKDGISHKSDFLGDGVISIIRILAHLFNEESTGLIIDEPELSLHPLAQKKLIKLIEGYAQRRQIIIATHSPYFISWDYIKNGAVLNRVAKDDDTNSCIHTLSEYSDYAALINGANWQQPFLMDVVSKEIFFQDNILFVEGQEDVGLLQNYFENKDINFFGYGVRGYDQFKVAFKIAQDLGIKKACILIDSPDPQNIARNDKNENTVRDDLKKNYESYGYKVIQWNKTDIRDKEKYIFTEKEGYFTKDGKLKENRDDFDEKINLIYDYFS